MNIDKSIDASGLPSPLPILKAQREIRHMRPGQMLRVIASGRQAALDFRDYAKLSGNPLKSADLADEKREYLIQKR